MAREVPFFNYQAFFRGQEEQFVSVFRDVGRRGAFILQQDVKNFESDLAQFLGVKYALGVANCTDGLTIALKAAGIGPGDEVIFCSHTFVATAAAIHNIGATPVPADIGSDHLISADSVAKLITSKTKAIMPTQVNGRTCDMDAISALAQKHKLLIIEDSAQALGSKFNGRFAGTFGLAGTFSFYPAKLLGALGDAGAVITNDDKMYEDLLLLRDHGRNKEGEVVRWGFNTRLDNVQAALLAFQFKNYKKVIERRREIATMYQEKLGSLKELTLPPHPMADARHFDVYQNYEIEADRRDQLKEFLKQNGIGTLIQWNGKAVHQFKGLGLKASLPNVEKMFTRCVMIPMNMFITNDDVDHVCTTIRKFYGH